MSNALHPAATHHLPAFITAPGETDVLLSVTAVFLIIAILTVGVLYLRLHALPEHIAHRTDKVKYQVVAVLALLALFTHNHIYWIAGLLLALVRIPDFSTPLAGNCRVVGQDGRQQTAPAQDQTASTGVGRS